MMHILKPDVFKCMLLTCAGLQYISAFDVRGCSKLVFLALGPLSNCIYCTEACSFNRLFHSIACSFHLLFHRWLSQECSRSSGRAFGLKPPEREQLGSIWSEQLVAITGMMDGTQRDGDESRPQASSHEDNEATRTTITTPKLNDDDDDEDDDDHHVPLTT